MNTLLERLQPFETPYPKIATEPSAKVAACFRFMLTDLCTSSPSSQYSTHWVSSTSLSIVPSLFSREVSSISPLVVRINLSSLNRLRKDHIYQRMNYNYFHPLLPLSSLRYMQSKSEALLSQYFHPRGARLSPRCNQKLLENTLEILSPRHSYPRQYSFVRPFLNRYMHRYKKYIYPPYPSPPKNNKLLCFLFNNQPRHHYGLSLLKGELVCLHPRR